MQASEDGINLLYQMLCYDPYKRPTASQLLQHKFFDKIKNKENLN